MLDILLVGHTPLGSALRAVVVSILLTLFWTFFIAGRWQLLTVSLITALAVIVAAHFFSRRDDPLRPPQP